MVLRAAVLLVELGGLLFEIGLLREELALMPKDASKLPLSKMNMGGAGTVMMKKVMKDKNVDSLEYLMQNAKNAGVKMIACAMSMDVMGIQEEELLDGVEVGGVATYLGEATEGNVNLFI